MSTLNINEQIELLLSQSRSFFVIDLTGILLHYENFIDIDEDPDLYAGLLAAINTYSKELKAGDIKNATLENHKFVFAEDDKTGYLIIMNVNRDMSNEDGAWLLEQIVLRFKEMQELMADDIKGNLSLETLFSERGKTIDWNTIQKIRGSAIKSIKQQSDKVETLNLSKINMRNRFWVRVRKIITTLIENQPEINGCILIIKKQGELNKLYCGREGMERLSPVYNYMNSKFDEGIVGLEIETELVQISDLYCGVHTIFNEEGGLLTISSTSSYAIKRIANQMERITSAIERLGNIHQ